MKAAGKPVYAALPARAMVDRRLSERHLRTLAVVAAHDRFAKNGIGCYASHERLAEMIGCNYARLSSNLTDLGNCGYIERVPHPLNKRLRVYRVIYNEQDAQVMKSITNSSPIGKVLPSDSLPIGEGDRPDSLPVQSAKYQETIGLSNVNIFRETGIDEAEAFEKIPLNGAGEKKGASKKAENIGFELAKFERALQAGAHKNLNLNRWESFLREVIDSTEYDDPNHGRAERLLMDVASPRASTGG